MPILASSMQGSMSFESGRYESSVARLEKIAKRTSDVTTQTRQRQTNRNGGRFPKTLSKAAGIPKTLT